MKKKNFVEYNTIHTIPPFFPSDPFLKTTPTQKKSSLTLKNVQSGVGVIGINEIHYPFNLGMNARRSIQCYPLENPAELNFLNSNHNLYLMNKPFLALNSSYMIDTPSKMDSPYADFQDLIGKITSKIIIRNDEFSHSQVFLYINEKNIRFIMKRYFMFINVNDHSNSEKIDLFVGSNYEEYAKMKLFEVCPYSVHAYAFRFTYVIPINCYVTELLIEYLE